MKNPSKSSRNSSLTRFLALSLGLTVAGVWPSAHAASDTWNNAADNNWQTVTNWLSGTQFPGATSGFASTDDATFSTTGASGTINLGDTINIRTLIYGVSGGDAAAFTIGDANDTLNLTTAGGVTINAGVTTAQNIGVAGTTINLSTAANSAATFNNNGAGLLTVAGNVTTAAASGNSVLTLTGTSGGTVSGNITNGATAGLGITKAGAGTWAISGTNTLTTGALTVNLGTLNSTAGSTTLTTGQVQVGGALTAGATTVARLNLTGNSTITSAATAFTGYAGSGANSLGVINVASGSTLSFTATTNSGGNIGSGTNSAGAIFNAGSLTNTAASGAGAGFFLGNAAGAYGYLQSSGTTSISGRLNIGQINGAAGVVDINGGTTTVAGTAQAANVSLAMNLSGGSAQLNVTNGGVLTESKTDILTVNNSANASYASLNVTGAGSKLVTTTTGGVSFANNTATNTGTLTLGSGAGTGGELDASFVFGGNTSTNVLTFNGGTLKATATNAQGLIQPFVSTFVQAGGGTIDNGGFVVTVPTALKAPVADGTTTFAVTGSNFAATANNSFLGAPVVKFTGGGGTGAAGYAVFDAVNGRVSSIVITSPGSGYTSAPTITLVGGTAVAGGGSAAFGTTFTATTGAVSGGGMTFLGSGTTTLSGANTYTGNTTLTNGKLRLTNISGTSATGTGDVAVSGGVSAVLAGTGFSSGNTTVTNGGRLAPGVNSTDADASGRNDFGSAGTLSLATTATKTLTLTNANVDFDLASTAAGTSDLVTADVLNLTSSTVVFHFNGLTAGTLQTGTAYTLINANTLNGFNTANLSADFLGSLNGNYTAAFSQNGTADLQVTFAAAPEPSTWAMMLGGLGMLAGFQRRRRFQG